MNESFIAKFPLPVFMAGNIMGILFFYGIAYIALKIDIEKAEPVFKYYGIGFSLGAVTAVVCIMLAWQIFKNPGLSKTINQEVQNG